MHTCFTCVWIDLLRKGGAILAALGICCGKWTPNDNQVTPNSHRINHKHLHICVDKKHNQSIGIAIGIDVDISIDTDKHTYMHAYIHACIPASPVCGLIC